MQFNATEMKELNAALEKAFATMQDNVKRVQDTATNALEEVRKEGTLHTKTNEQLTELGKKGNELAENFREVRQRVLEVEQKLSSRVPGSGGSSDAQKSLAEIIVESPEFKAAQQKPMSKTMDAVTVGSFHKTQIINATGQNQPLVPSQRTPGIITPAEQRLYIRDLLPQSATASNLIEFASEATYTNNARPQGDASPGGIEGEEFAESAMTFTLSSAAVVTIGHWIPASRQVMSDAQMLAGHISGRLVYGLKLEEEEEILTGTGAAGTINGLNNQAAAYNRGVTNDTILDTLLKALLQVSLSNYEASGFVLHPVDWYGAMLLKDTQNRYLFSDPQSMVQPRVWAKPVVASQTQTQGRFLAGAFNLGAQIWDREDATVRISENVDDHFIRNMVAILAEERLALTVYRTTAFVFGNTGHAG
jgi:HK97 family phage major capsid protein